MPPSPPVTLQINLTPGDYPSAVLIVPHQLRQLASQVSEILLTIDTGGGNLLAQRKDEAAFVRLMDWIDGLKAEYPHLRASEVDYRPETIRRVSQLYFGCDRMPTKTYRGAFYAYFEGMHQALSDYVLHLDSDILLGGGSQTWIQEAVAWLESHPNVLACSPLPGPPAPDFRLRNQGGERLSEPRGAYSFQSMSTRIFFLDRRRIEGAKRKIHLRRTALRQQIRAWLEGFSPMALPETLITDYMLDMGLCRVDFLGEPPGLWTLHPPFRNASFFQRLPDIIQAVETETMPNEQLGDHDINDSMVDWSSARELIRANRWWKRYFSRLGVSK